MNEREKAFVIWVAMAVSQVICLVLPAGQGPTATGEGPSAFGLVAATLGLAAAIETVVLVVVLRRGALGPIEDGRLDPAAPAGAARLLAVLIVGWALAESVAIYGLVLRFLGAPATHWLPFAAAGGILLLVARPWQPGLSRPATSAELARSGRPL
jgi:hypothetical protein